jgi:hypothetical protein
MKLRYIIQVEKGVFVITCSKHTYTHAREIPIGFSTGVHVNAIYHAGAPECWRK